MRRRAADQLKSVRAVAGESRIVTDAQHLVRELQLQQVELQQRNTQLQEARARAEVLLEKYTELYDFAPVGYFSLSAAGRIKLANLTGARLIGLERSKLVGRRLEARVVPGARPAFRTFLRRVFAGVARCSCEVSLFAAGRRVRTVRIEAERSLARQECRAVITDITVRRQAEAARRRAEKLAAANLEANREIARRRVVEATLRASEAVQRRLVAEAQELHAQLRHVTRQILLAQEAERLEISHELHDEIAQTLAGINVQLAALAGVASLRPRDLRKRITQTQRLVAQSVTAVHRYARELRPSLLDDLGLIPALRSFIKDLPNRKGLRIQFVAAPEVESLDNIHRTVLYRVAQEALTNVTRHAHAARATVRLSRMPLAVRLMVHDNGKSFPVERLIASNTNQRLGLIGMRERVEMVGGVFSIESCPGHGTTVRAEVPVRIHP